ncbi:uncharacterized protein LOC143278444, partial [Babylonia areolata]|uniref:uncharacterized protein LOC143278444 n=1 Tax=Babylonia areolata TaxID=304850 RepID=UPI003FD6BF8B
EQIIPQVQAAKNLAEADKRLAVYENYVRKLAARVLSVDVSGVTPEVSLVDLGMDSIVAMTMINQIHRDTARRLPAVVFVTGEPTVGSIAEAIDEAPEDGAEGSAEEEGGGGGGVRITELEDEEGGSGVEPSVEVSTIESQELVLYKQHPRRESLHGTVDIQLETYQAHKDRVQRAIVAVLAKHPSARAIFNEDRNNNSNTNGGGGRGVTHTTTTTSSRRFRRSTLTAERCFDLRVIGENEVLGEALDTHSTEPFDVHRCGPVRFVLVEKGRGPEASMLRVVFHKAAFDLRSASILVADLIKCLESSDSASLPVTTREEAPGTVTEANKLNKKLEQLYQDRQKEIVQFWEPKLSSCTIQPSTLTMFSRSDSTHGQSELGSVKVVVPQGVLLRLRNFILFHDVTLLGVVGSCYQVLLHTLTGERSVPLVFPLDLRKMGLDISDHMANYCNDIPFIAHFGSNGGGGGGDGAATSTTTLQNFVLANDRDMMRDIKHGILPLSMFESLSSPVRDVFNSCRHGLSIDILNHSLVNGNGYVNGNGKVFASNNSVNDNSRGGGASGGGSSGGGGGGGAKCKAKDARKLHVLEGAAVMMPRDLETNLVIEHQLTQGVLSLTLTYKRSILDRVKAEAMLRALVFAVTRLLNHPDTSLRKMVRLGLKFKRRLAKKGRKAARAAAAADVTFAAALRHC